MVTIHDLIFEVLPKTYKWADRKIYRQKVLNSCQYADQILAISERTKSDICYYYNIEPEKIKVIYQAVENRYYKKNIRENIPLPLTTLPTASLPSNYILSVGTFQARKNQISILKAWRALPKVCLLYTSPSPRDATLSRMPSSA